MKKHGIEPRVMGRSARLKGRLVHHLLPGVVVLPEAPHQVVVCRWPESADELLRPEGVIGVVLGDETGWSFRMDMDVGCGTKEPGPAGEPIKNVAPSCAEEVAGPGLFLRLRFLEK
jgi:hypothetical protein